MSLELQPISQAEAFEFIRRHHRHHNPPQGWKFGVAVSVEGEVVGVATAGRPVGRGNDDGWTLEITRVCTDGARNAGSMLYGAITRAARALGYRRVLTYTLPDESGDSLRAAGWKEIRFTRGGSWNTPARPRVDLAPVGQKVLWEAQA